MSGGSLKLRGVVRAVLGDNIDTDIIFPGRYLNITDRELTAEHLFELAYPELRAAIRPGEFVVAGKNFGCGSSREQAAAALKFAVWARDRGLVCADLLSQLHQSRDAGGDRAGGCGGVRRGRRTGAGFDGGRDPQFDAGVARWGRRSWIRGPWN